MYRRSCVVLEAKGEETNNHTPPSVLCWRVSSIKQMFVGLVVCFFPMSYVVPLLRRWGKLGLLLNGRQAFIARGISPVSTPVYIISLAWNEKQRTETYREVIYFRVTFFCFFFLTSPISIVFFLPCSVKESFVRELQSLRFLREWEWAETSSAIVCPCSRSEAHRNFLSLFL